MEIQTLKIESLVADPTNARKHSKKNLDAIKGSLSKFGQQKPIVIDAKGVVVAGNGTLAAAQSLGWDEIKCVRTELTGPEAIAFALADNRTAELAEWNDDVLSKTLDSLVAMDFDITDIGFDEIILNSTSDEENSNYTRKVESPIYEPKGPKPKIDSLVDLSKVKNLIEEIDNSTIPHEEKQFLRIAAYRHAVFSYQNIAEYYAHSNADAQRLIENSALVIIDFNRAIELGYVSLAEDLANAYINGHEE